MYAVFHATCQLAIILEQNVLTFVLPSEDYIFVIVKNNRIFIEIVCPHLFLHSKTGTGNANISARNLNGFFVWCLMHCPYDITPISSEFQHIVSTVAPHQNAQKATLRQSL